MKKGYAFVFTGKRKLGIPEKLMKTKFDGGRLLEEATCSFQSPN